MNLFRQKTTTSQALYATISNKLHDHIEILENIKPDRSNEENFGTFCFLIQASKGMIFQAGTQLESN